jgi:lactoylglutathione lyase
MTFSQVDYIMVNVSEMNRSVVFYRDILGLSLKFESPGWSEFQTGASTLALHRVAASREDRAPAQPVPGSCSLGFSVADLSVTHRELVARGARFVLPPTEQIQEGIRLAVCVDPDGLAISFAEPLSRGAGKGEWE